jgi:hypothetical protein
MINLRNKVQLFVITNGRSTYEYVIKSLENQNVAIDITSIKDMRWVDALNKIFDLCTTPYFIRCDDDFFMHPYSVSFMYDTICKKEDAVMGEFKLWEDWSKRISGGVKIYNTQRTIELGKFKENHRGSVDGNFSQAIKNSKYSTTGSKGSVLAIHARASLDEMLQYEKIWNDNENKTFIKWKPDKKTTKQMLKYKKSVEDQFNMRINKLRKINRKTESDFYKVIKKYEK